jgi:hypothetical protein
VPIDGLDIGDRGFSRPPLDTLLVSYGRDPVSHPTGHGGSLTEAGWVPQMGLRDDGTMLHSVADRRLRGFPRVDGRLSGFWPATGPKNQGVKPWKGTHPWEVFSELSDFPKFVRQSDPVEGLRLDRSVVWFDRTAFSHPGA